MAILSYVHELFSPEHCQTFFYVTTIVKLFL
jgi:hypothetical protein